MKTLVRSVLVLMLTMVMGAVGLQVAHAAPALEMAGDSSAAMHNAEGIKHYNKGHWDKAATHFKEAMQADPESGVTHYNYALVLDKMGKHMDAAKHFKKAKEVGKGNPDIQNSGILDAHLDMLEDE